MPITSKREIDQLVGLLQSGELSEEETGRVQNILKSNVSGLELYEKVQANPYYKYGAMFRDEFKSLDEQNQNLYTAFTAEDEAAAAEERKLKLIKNKHEFWGGVAGMGKAANRVWGNVALLLGEDNEDLVQAAAERGEDYTSFAMDKAVRMYQDALGRNLTPEEMQWVKDRNDKIIKGGQFVQDAALFAGTGGVAGTVVKAKGILTGMGVFAAEGALTGALTADTDNPDQSTESRIATQKGTAAFGGLLGGGIGLLPGMGAAIKGYFAKPIEKALSRVGDDGLSGYERFTLYNRMRGADQQGEGGRFAVSLGQVTGDPRIQAAEELSKGGRAMEFLLQQQRELPVTVANHMGVLTRRLQDMDSNVYADVRAAFGDFKRVEQALRGARQSNWQEGEKILREMDGYADGSVRFAHDFASLEDRINYVVGQVKDVYSPSAGNVMPEIFGKNLKAFMRDVKRWKTEGVTPQELDHSLTKLSNWVDDPHGTGAIKKLDVADSPPKENKMIGLINEIRKGFDDDIAKMVARSGSEGWSQQARGLVTQLKKHRDQWKLDTERMDAINEAVIHRLVGKDNVTTALQHVPVDTLRTVVRMLRSMNGGSQKIQDMVTSAFEQAVLSAGEAAAAKGAATGALDIGVLVDNLSQTAHKSTLAGLISKDQHKRAVEGIGLMRSILNEGAVNNTIKHRIVTGLDNILINFVSRDPGFLARLMGAAISRGKGAEWLFFSEEGINILRNLKSGWQDVRGATAVNMSAVGALTGMLEQGTSERIAEEYVQENMGQKQ